MPVSAARERIDGAVRLERSDRVPLVPSVGIFAARYSGISQRDMLFDINKAGFALRKMSRELGEVDGFLTTNAGLGDLLRSVFVTQPVLPGVDGVDEEAIWQFEGRTVMGQDEYAALAENPERFIMAKTIESQPDMDSSIDFRRASIKGYLAWARVQLAMRAWRRDGLEPIAGANIVSFPLERIATSLRTGTDFVKDLYQNPDELKRACKAMMKQVKRVALFGPSVSGVRRAFIGLSWISGSMIGPKRFEELVLPELEELVDHLVSHRITPILHLGNDWTGFFGCFRDFPRGTCILNVDGLSDILKAKELLCDRMCIMGDVPAALLKLGEPEEVDEYCRRLIMEVGPDGGFILGSGGDMPIDTKPLNASAMFRSVYRYGSFPARERLRVAA